MFNLKNVRIKKKLVGMFLITGLVPILIIGFWSSRQATDALMKEASHQLESVRGIKRNQIKEYFATHQVDMDILVDTLANMRKDSIRSLSSVKEARISELKQYLSGSMDSIELLASSKDTDDLYHQLVDYHNKTKVQPDGPYDVSTEEYQILWSEYGKQITLFKEKYGLYDVFMICANHGHVMYTVAREADLGTNIRTGPYRGSGLNTVWAKTVESKSRSIVDFTPYAPSNNLPTAFVGVPLFLDGELHGVLAVQISAARINDIMSLRTGLGETGDAYLVGQDYLMRSDSFKDPEYHSLNASFADPENGRVGTKAVELALSGKEGEDLIMGMKGQPVLSVFAPFEFMDLQWAIVAEMDLIEVFNPVDMQGNEYYAKYIEEYGYLDLLLVDPEGHVFYTVKKRADYQANLIDGKYAGTHLGKLVRRILEEKRHGMTDFGSYGPNNGEPAAFLAEPVLHYLDKDIEMLVVLEFSYEGINEVMMFREGMGKTGESYLVGPDRLMRSDLYLDRESHSVSASFAGTVEENGMDTETVRKALAGESRTEVGPDFRGHQVLSSYTPVKISDDITWALLAEIDKSEIQAPIRSLIFSIVVVALVMALLITVIALVVARQIAGPLEEGVAFAETISGKDLTSKLHVEQLDEMGDLARSLNGMAGNLASMIREVDGGVGTISSSSTEMASIADQMASRAGIMVEKANAVASAAEEMNSNMSSVAASMEESATNIGTVASGAEQMSSSIAEIAENASRARESADNAVSRTDQASRQVNELGKAAEEIGVVSETIKAISDKTNLLALNATIEAARAGDAGKGFAVVANEIKELAQQTAEATEDISSKLQDIQKSTGGTVSQIKEVGDAIRQLEEVVSAIAGAVEEQSASTREISENVSQASMGLQEINENVSQTSEAAAQVARDITEVNEAADEMSTSSAQVQQSAGELSKLAEQLKALVSQFKL